MKFRRQRKTEQGVNLTPLIDVVFLLLIFFMVSTTFTKETHLEVSLPEAEGQPNPDLPDSIEIVIARDGSYSINGEALVNRQPETIVKALNLISGGDTSIPLVITADADATHQSFVTAADAAGRAGFVHLSVTSRRPESTGQ
ncbi:biopolymer transporter ExbD [Porticoccaceae bacterium LTM1]|nr:biopolymer transporter ExbD [Porticoccaceae bacterium LTM1]